MAKVQNEIRTIDLEENHQAEGSDFMDALQAHLDDRKNPAAADGDGPAADDVPPQKEEGQAPESTDEVADDREVEASGDDDPAVSEALLERAVKVGLSLADAKAVGNADVLDRLIGRLESSGKADAGKTSEEAPPKDILADMPDLDPDEYAEEVVKGFSVMKAAIAALQEQNAGLREQLSSGSSESRSSWLDVEVAKLGKDYSDVFGDGVTSEVGDAQRAARQKLERAITFVQSEAESDGKKMSRSEAVQAALKFGFADKVKSVKGAAAKAAAAKRSQQVINRPRSSDGTFAKNRDYEPGSMADRHESAIRAVADLMESV